MKSSIYNKTQVFEFIAKYEGCASLTKNIANPKAKLLHNKNISNSTILYPYKCPANIWTIGYGDTLSCKNRAEVDLKKGFYSITYQQAKDNLSDHIINFYCELRPFVKVGLNENQWTALLSMAFNFGITKLIKYKVFKAINDNDVANINKEWLDWNYKGLGGLKIRREAELLLFNKPSIH